MVKVPFNDLFLQIEDDLPEYMADIENCIRNSSFIGGQHVLEFENLFAKTIGTQHAVSCGNGTDSLHLAMKALDLGPGDEVIVPAMSWISTSETVTSAGGEVVFCDIDLESYTIDVDKIENLINEKTVGIIPVHLYGHAADMERIMEIAKKEGYQPMQEVGAQYLKEGILAFEEFQRTLFVG